MTADECRLDSNRIAVHPILGEDRGREAARLALDGRSYIALAGNATASALRAHGIAVRRMLPVTDAPRAVFRGCGRCPDRMMTGGGAFNLRACVTPGRDGMALVSQLGLEIWTGASDADD